MTDATRIDTKVQIDIGACGDTLMRIDTLAQPTAQALSLTLAKPWTLANATNRVHALIPAHLNIKALP